MKVRGISILTRKIIVSRRFGTDAWHHLYRDVSATHSCFRSLITADSLVPLQGCLALHDELIRRFYNDEQPAHIQLGRESARWAVGDGPFKGFIGKSDLTSFVASFPKLWSTYFTDTSSRCEAAMKADSIELKAFDLPQWHPYLEHFVMGYMTEVLEMFCANPIVATRLRGGGGTMYHYLLEAALEGGGAGTGERTPPARQAARYLSHREFDVLMLVAKGKTNEEIGMVLGISKKTAQHHIARAYRKIGVYTRVGAALWMAEHGLIGA